MTSHVAELVELLSLERLEDNLFRGQSRDIGTKYVFGGQVLGQALAAAQATLERRDPPRAAHSLHAYFLRASVAWAAASAWPSTCPPNTYLVPMSRLWPRNRLSSSRSSESSSTSSATWDGMRGTFGADRGL